MHEDETIKSVVSYTFVSKLSVYIIIKNSANTPQIVSKLCVWFVSKSCEYIWIARWVSLDRLVNVCFEVVESILIMNRTKLAMLITLSIEDVRVNSKHELGQLSFARKSLFWDWVIWDRAGF